MRFQNPILSGFHPDPSMCRVGDDFFLVTSSFEYFPGLPLFQSRDLVHWRQAGHIINRPSQLPGQYARPSGGIFAPTLRFHEGVFYLITTNIDGGGNFVVTATDSAGPWSDPFWIEGAEGIDPSLFFDDDGRCWYAGNGNPVHSLYEGHHTIWLQEFDIRTMRLIGEKRVIVDGGSDITQQPIWIEGPHVYKKDGRYYLLAAEGGTAEDHSVVVFRSDSITGPYEFCPGNPILTNRDLDPARPDPITCTGHGDLVQTRTGEWWMVLLACRPDPPGLGNDSNMGRETFLVPVSWQDGWPVTADGTGRLAASYAVPDLPAHPWADGYGLGEMHWHDDFGGARLRPEWNRIGPPGGPEETWHSLAARPGFLRLIPRPQGLTEPDQPSFLGVRQRHKAFTAETALEFHPAAEGDAAGLVMMQNPARLLRSGVCAVRGADPAAPHQTSPRRRGRAGGPRGSAPVRGKRLSAGGCPGQRVRLLLCRGGRGMAAAPRRGGRDYPEHPPRGRVCRGLHRAVCDLPSRSPVRDRRLQRLHV